MRAYDLLKALHLLLVIIWLGTDIGTYASFQRLLNEKLSLPTRLSMSRLSDVLDQGPRSGLVLLLMLGISMTYMGDWGLRGGGGLVLAWMAAVVGLVWFAGVWHQFWVHRAPADQPRSPRHLSITATFRKVDLWWRVALAIVLVGASIVSLATSGDDGPFAADWLAWKLLVFAGIVACGVAIRISLPKIGAAIGAIVSSGSTPERESALRAASRPAIVAVWLIWVFLIVMTTLAVFKPGL